ncbi:Pentatricopeptide repeat-containing protein [Quillaja saponaria]|uniref:Pentatricopeptide repeat-containing protein n=1 Tax=Quillaja saponaria TaxID=32244 RepID=A0AAD7KYF4_QUISA|nr:Pentatricopeptide repeat-containing protein [Quillaja saponaria]
MHMQNVNVVGGARRAFDELLVKDVIFWTSLASSYVHCGLPRHGLGLLCEMGLDGVKPNAMTVSTILPACSELKDLLSGQAIHGFVVRNGIGENVFVCGALVSMYARCMSIKQDWLVFDNISHHDIVSWNVILTAYFTNRECKKGLALFYHMRNEGV